MKRNVMKKAISLVLALAMMATFMLPAGAANLRIGKVTLNQSRTVITLDLAEEIELNEGVDLASQITIKKDSSAATALPFGSTAVVEDTTVKIQLTTPLNSKSTIVTIARGTFVDQGSEIVSSSFDAKGPETIKNVAIDNTKKVVTLEFDGAIESALGTNTIESGAITLARDGNNFNEDISSSQIAVNGEAGTIKITLSSALTGTNSRFKIATATLAYATSKNINIEELVTPAISALKVVPKYTDSTGFKMDSDFSTITMTFDKDIYFASNEIKNRIDEYILIAQGGNNFLPLNINDRVSISGKVLTIKLRYPIETDSNRIKIRENVLMGENGDVIDTEIVTRSFGVSDIQYEAPMYKGISYDKAKKQVSIKFTETIYAVSISGLKNMIQISRNGGSYQDLSAYDVVEIYGDDTILITLDEGLSGEKNRFRIQPNAIKGDRNNVQMVLQLTGIVDTSAESYEEFEAEFKVSDDKKTVDIIFDRQIQSNYPYDTDLSYVKQEISIMRNAGYNELGASDYIAISGRTLRIVFQRAISSTDIIKIGKFALKDSYGTIMSNDVKVGMSISANGEILDLNSGVTLSIDKKTVTIDFNERVYNNMASLTSLKQMIRVAYNGVDFEKLTDDVKFDFQGTGLMTITFPQTLSNPEALIKILPGALQNSKGETIDDEIITNPLGRSAENTKVTIDDTRVYIGTEEEDTDLSENRLYTMTINATKATSVVGSMAKGGTLKAEFPEYAYSATLAINGTTLKQLIDKNANILVKAMGATHVFKAAELQFDEALENLGITDALAQNADLEISISRTGAPYEGNLEKMALAKSFKILTAPLKLTVAYNGINKTYVLNKYNDYVEKEFSLKLTDAQSANITVVRVEESGKVNPVPTAKKVTTAGYYLTAKVKNNGVYGVISADRSFTDTPSWATTAVNTLASRLILQNASNGPCRAQDAVTRAEVAEMVTRALGILTDRTGVSKFFDVLPTDWFFSSTTIAVENDFIRGYGDGSYGPQKKITRQEVMTIMARVMEHLGDTEDKDMTMDEAKQILSKFKDAADVADWAKVNMAKCVNAEVVRGDNNQRLNPNASLTRAEMSQLIYNLMLNYGLLG